MFIDDMQVNRYSGDKVQGGPLALGLSTESAEPIPTGTKGNCTY